MEGIKLSTTDSKVVPVTGDTRQALQVKDERSKIIESVKISPDSSSSVGMQKNQDVSRSVEGLQRTFSQINDVLKQSRSTLLFEVNQEAETVIIKVVDQETGETIRQIPSEEMLKISKNITQYLEQIQSQSHQSSYGDVASSGKIQTGLIMDSQA